MLQEIADRAGVAKSTVSYVLRGKHRQMRITDAMAERIRAVAAELNLQPNAAARAMRTGRHDAIGLLLTQDAKRNTPFLALWQGIAHELESNDTHLTIGHIDESRGDDATYLPRMLREWSVDGLLIDYGEPLPARILAALAHHRLAHICINVDMPTDAVRPDDHAAGSMLVERLATAGHRRICYFAYPPHDHDSHAAREAGYRTAMARLGLQPQVERLRGVYGAPTWAADIREFLEAHPDITAVCGYEREAALAACFAGAMLGRAPGSGLSVVAIASEPVHYAGFALDTLQIPVRQIGREAVRALNRRISSGQPQPTISLPFTWEPGTTVAPPRG